jgi:hypothetical protein
MEQFIILSIEIYRVLQIKNDNRDEDGKEIVLGTLPVANYVFSE